MKKNIEDEIVKCPKCGHKEKFRGLLVCFKCFRKGNTVKLVVHK